MQFTAQEDDHKTRLDKFLKAKMPEFSRSKIKKMIEHGLVTVNDEKPTVHEWLKSGDIIHVLDAPEKEKQPLPAIEILHEGNGFLAINKPAGILTHHAQGFDHEPSIAEWLVNEIPEAKDVGDPDRPGIVHRLDRETSGVLLLATSKEMYDHLKSQFHDREIEKVYLSLVHGNLPHPSGVIDKPIGRSKEGRMAARTKKLSENDRDAQTAYQVLRSFKDYDFVEAKPTTGRTHQIRVHLMSLGHPIVGDKIYTIHGQKKVIDLGRIFLHASQISLTDLSGERITVSSPLPEDLQQFLDSLT